MVQALSPDPDAYLGYTIVRLAHVLERRMDVALRAAGLSVRRFGALAQLAHRPGLGSAELARLILITPQSTGALLDGLERDGLIVRDRSAGPGNRLAVTLTGAGRSALGRGYAIADRLRAEEAALLPAGEQAQLNATLAALLEALGSRQDT